MGVTDPQSPQSRSEQEACPRGSDGPVPPVLPSLRLSVIVKGCLFGLFLCLLVEVGHVYFACNVHVVIPGAVYRSSQPSGHDLEWLVRKYGIRTVINLRGFREQQGWYIDECRAANRLGVSVEDISLSAGHLPPVQEMRRLMEVLDRSEYPILFHCFRGVDRTGLASVVTLLLRTDLSLEKARQALSLRYLHLPWGRTGRLDEFFDLYEEWLCQKGRTHSRAAFRSWLERDYCGGACSCRLELIAPVLVGPRAVPFGNGELPWLVTGAGPASAEGIVGRLRVPRGEPFALRVRCHNTSIRSWRLSPDLSAGVHAGWVLTDAQDQYLAAGMAGRFHAEVRPGSSIDLTVALPPLHQSGRYSLQIDMAEEQHSPFHQIGSEPLDLELEVP